MIKNLVLKELITGSDENFEEIGVIYHRSVISQDKNFCNVNFGLKEREIKNTIPTNNIKIKYLSINNQPLIYEYDKQIEFVKKGNEFTCILIF